MLSLANLVDAIGAGLGPLIGGLLYKVLGSLQLVFIFASIINITGFILWIPMYKNIQKDITDVDKILLQHKEELKLKIKKDSLGNQ
jgi:MFS family permease